MASLTEAIYSDDYMDLLVRSYVFDQEPFQQLGLEDSHRLLLNSQYSVLYLRRSAHRDILSETFPYNTIPKLFMPLDTQAVEAAGIRQVQNQPVLSLKGRGVLTGFIDTGIDYTHPAFRNSLGRSRIISIWDQTDTGGTPPEFFPYGSVYSQEDIDRALNASDPYSVVPSLDDTGHGTALAGIAAGSADLSAGFLGAAPESGILMVKLKTAKEYLRDFAFASPKATLYQENDIIAAYLYLVRTAQSLQMPLIVCLALGSSQGGHSGETPLSSVLERYGNVPGIVPVVACGNEAGRAHHFYPANLSEAASAGTSGDISPSGTPASMPVTVEIRVPENAAGFLCEIWGQPPQNLSVGFRSPVGETIPRIPVSLDRFEQIRFALEETMIHVSYNLILPSSGSQLIFLRFHRPTAGIWNLLVYGASPEQRFHIWLPVYEFLDRDVTFLSPDPYTTLTTPSAASAVISVGAYNSGNGSLYIHSGRGFTRTGGIKPDLCAPGVSVTAPGLDGTYIPVTGTSAAAAMTAGAAALLMEWAAKRQPSSYLTAYETKIYLIRGAVRMPDLLYPSQEWGYGTLELYRSFLSLLTF